MIFISTIKSKVRRAWFSFWMRYAGQGFPGRIALSLAERFTAPYLGRCHLAQVSPRGYIASSAVIHMRRTDLRLGVHTFIGERVLIFQDPSGGTVTLGDRTHLYGDTYIQLGQGGCLQIGADTHIQPRCQFSAYKANIQIGSNVQIAPACAFYPYDHSFAPGTPIRKQPLRTRGDIIIEDDTWLGYGVIVLSGVRIGTGAVIGAGSVVTNDIPAGAIAVGSPARVTGMRGELAVVVAAESSQQFSDLQL